MRERGVGEKPRRGPSTPPAVELSFCGCVVVEGAWRSNRPSIVIRRLCVVVHGVREEHDLLEERRLVFVLR
jgi:hypothetical protein